MTPEASFLADLGDPTAVLIYADWLEDQGRDREDAYRLAGLYPGWTPSGENPVVVYRGAALASQDEVGAAMASEGVALRVSVYVVTGLGAAFAGVAA